MIEGPLRQGGAEGQYVGGQGDKGVVSRAGAALEGVGEEWKEEVCWGGGKRQKEATEGGWANP